MLLLRIIIIIIKNGCLCSLLLLFRKWSQKWATHFIITISLSSCQAKQCQQKPIKFRFFFGEKHTPLLRPLLKKLVSLYTYNISAEFFFLNKWQIFSRKIMMMMMKKYDDGMKRERRKKERARWILLWWCYCWRWYTRYVNFFLEFEKEESSERSEYTEYIGYNYYYYNTTTTTTYTRYMMNNCDYSESETTTTKKDY